MSLGLAIALVWAVAPAAAEAKPPDHASDSDSRQPPANLKTNSYDIADLYKGIPTPGHTWKAPQLPIEGEATTTSAEEVAAEEEVHGPVKKTVTRYPVISVSFHRVETPFIIGLWIFFASLAKIGKLFLITV